MKPTIRLSMISCTQSYPFADGFRTYRVDGHDTWMAKLTYATPEGQITQKTFVSVHKREALYKAYDCLQDLTRDLWFAEFHRKQWEIYSPYFKEAKGMEAMFNESIAKVYLGEYTREKFIGIWEDRLAYHKAAVRQQNIAPSGNYDPRMDERCDPVETKRWWQFWS